MSGAIRLRFPTIPSLVSIVRHPSSAPQNTLDGTSQHSRSNSWFWKTRSNLLTTNGNSRSSYHHTAVNIMNPDSRFKNVPDPIVTHQSRVLQQRNFDAFLQALESRFNATPEFTINHRPHKESGLGNVIRGVMTTVFVASVTERSFHSTRFDGV